MFSERPYPMQDVGKQQNDEVEQGTQGLKGLKGLKRPVRT
jgi:hypothetical protein